MEVETANQCGGRKKIFSQEVDVFKNKNFEDITIEQLQAGARYNVQSLGFEETGGDSICICFVTKHHYTELPWFSFSLFYILLFSVHIVNVNTANNGTVLHNLSVNMYIFVQFWS